MAYPPSPRSSSSTVSVTDLNESIKEQVQAAVTRFAEVLNEDPDGSDILELPGIGEGRERRRGGGIFEEPAWLRKRQSALEELEEERRRQEKLLVRLHEEVELMEDEMKRREGGMAMESNVEMEKALFGLVRRSGTGRGGGGESEGGTEGAESNREHEKAMKNLKAQIKLDEAFNGIQFTSAEWEIVAKDGPTVHRKHTHIGSAYGFLFEVDFLVREEKSEGSDPSDPPDLARIIALSTSLDPRIEHHLQHFTSRVSMDLDLMNFYQTYVKYVILVNDRRDTFTQARSRFRRFIEIPDGLEGDRIHFSLNGGPSLFFTWRVSVSERGFVDSSLGLQIKSHPNASDDDLAAVSRLPQLLQKMVRVQGNKEALLGALDLFHPATS